MEFPWDYIGAATGGGVLGALIHWLSARARAHPFVLQEIDRAVKTALASLNDEVVRLTNLNEIMRKEIEELEEALERCWLEQDLLNDEIRRLKKDALDRGKF